MTTGELLLRLIVDSGLTIERAARYLGMGERTLVRYCLGNYPIRRTCIDALRWRRYERLTHA